MKSLILATAILASATSVFARNPQIRACYEVGGRYVVANSTDDQFGLCILGESLVGSIDILNRDNAIEFPLSLHYYKKGVQACPAQNRKTLTSLDGLDEISVCMYVDNSIVDIETLAAGKNNERNAKLNEVLGLR